MTALILFLLINPSISSTLIDIMAVDSASEYTGLLEIIETDRF